MNLSDVLKRRRKDLGLTLLEVANKVGVSEATVQRWESGNIKNLRHERISKLAEVLNVTPAYLMGWEEKEATNKKTPTEEQEPSDEDIQFALFGEHSEITEEIYNDVKSYARFKMEEAKRKK